MTPKEYVERIEALDLEEMMQTEKAARKAKRLFVKVLIASAVIGTVVGVKAVHAAEYPGLLRVTATEKEVVVGVDANGFEWSFAEVGHDYETGDLCAVIYDDKETEIIFDDEIVAHRYVGTTKMYGGSK